MSNTFHVFILYILSVATVLENEGNKFPLMRTHYLVGYDVWHIRQ